MHRRHLLYNHPNTSVYLRRSPSLLGFGFLRCFVYNHPNMISLAANGQSFSRGARGQEKEKEHKFRGLLASLPPERNVTWFFDGLQQYYERLPIHPPKHGLPADYAICSWPWLSRVSALGAPVPCLLFALVYVKHAVCSMVSRQQHTRTSARATYHSYRNCNLFFFFEMNIKRLLCMDRVMRVRLNLPTALVLHF